MNGPTVWWPLPVAPERWFTEEERAVASSYHRPIERAAFWSSAAQLVGLLVVLGVSRSIDVGTAAVVAAISVAVAVPRMAADGWREFVHEPSFGRHPVSVGAFAFTTAGRIVLEVAALAVVALWIDRATASLTDIVIPAVLAFVVPVVSAVIGPRFVLATHRAIDVPADGVAAHQVQQLAAAHRVEAPRAVVLDPVTFEGANAFATGTGSRVTVAVSRRLLDGPPELFGHVVSHELAHLRRRHLWWSAIASGASLAVIVAVSSVITIAIDADSAASRLPVFVVVAGAVSVPFRLALAWWSRANERQADQDALVLTSVRPAVVKQLHVSDQAAVEPSRAARFFGAHPAPAERLERIERFRTAAPIDAN